MVPRVLQSWVAPRRVVRGLSAMPEGTKLAVLMAAMLVFLIAQAPANARLAQIDPAVPFQARMGGAMLAKPELHQQPAACVQFLDGGVEHAAHLGIEIDRLTAPASLQPN